MADVILENITKQYDSGVIAVSDLTLHVRSGELLAIVGPSGCGKTTTLRLIAGLVEPTEGLVRIEGRNVNQVSPADRNVAMVFQDDALYPHMTVRQNMAFGLKMRRVPRAEREEKIRAAAEALGITALLERRPGQLSGGERQRAALARALVRRPKVFLLDEPLANLDPTLRFQLREQIRILHRQINATMVYVTHDQEEAMALGTRIAVMHQGALLQVGTPMDVYRRPINRFVAGFIGSPAMNFIEGRLERNGSGMYFSNGMDVRVPVAPCKATLLQFHVGQAVTAGIRPGQLKDAMDADDRHVPLWARITHVEPLGGHTLLRTQTQNGTPILAQLDGARHYELDRHATLCIDPEQVQFFEPGEFGKSISHAADAIPT
jgi:multiple sugar transport system ATP-binding protein